MDPLRIGVLGCAAIARRRILPALRDDPDTELAAVASRDRDTARRTAGEFGCRAVHGYRALLERPDIDAVYLPLPAALHAHWTEAALNAGKHVLAEKPLTTDPAATRRLARLAAGHRLALMENVMFVHHPQHEAVRTLLADGAIGRPRHLHAAFAVPALPAHDIRHNPELGGGALLDTGVYPVRAALHLLGPRLRVAGATLTPGGPGHAVDIAGTALLHTPDGTTAQLTFGLDHAYRSRYEIWGTLGRITLDHAFTPPAGHTPRILLERPGTTEHLTLPAADQVRTTLTAFTAAARTAAPLDPDSLHQADLLHHIRRRASGPPPP
ncbi:Gfo/Idh/MocA family oxidoreductase [Streptomyces sp. CAU 1734]|uniref:Gfo/Idh/MocA family protein n=1 Tax=Streptomyces sp. CAU 1734 TaxID=3140360 RepID=UPI003261687E